MPTQPAEAGGLYVAAWRWRLASRSGTLDSGGAGYHLDTLGMGSRLLLNDRYTAMVTAPCTARYRRRRHSPLPAVRVPSGADSVAAPVVIMLTAPDCGLHLPPPILRLPRWRRGHAPHDRAPRCGYLRSRPRTRFGIATPRIVVAGLNPRGGEGRHLRREEIEVVGPGARATPRAGMHLDDLSLPTRCTRPQVLARGDCRAGDVPRPGLPGAQVRSFGAAVNVTLGLPIMRSSVDHGTALDLAGSGDAHPGSMRAAIRAAMRTATTAGQRVPEPLNRGPTGVPVQRSPTPKRRNRPLTCQDADRRPTKPAPRFRSSRTAPARPPAPVPRKDGLSRGRTHRNIIDVVLQSNFGGIAPLHKT